MEEERKSKEGREEAFVGHVIGKIQSDKAFAANLRRADNPDTEYQAWEILSGWCDLEKRREALPFALIGAAMARAKPDSDGPFGIGAALARCYEDGSKSDAAKAKLRRLLACDSAEEACLILRPILKFVESKGVPLDHSLLLSQMLRFGDSTRRRWAADFFNRKEADDVPNDS